jgi:hypothetical protein
LEKSGQDISLPFTKNKTREKSQTNKQPAKKPQQNKKSNQIKKPQSRTPAGRDMREDARQQQKHREELFRSREDYQRQKKY